MSNEAKRAPRRVQDLRIPNTTPEQLAKALLRGGAKPRPETKRRAAVVEKPVR